nr:hypothetical protein [Bacteroidota bacterium]
LYDRFDTFGDVGGKLNETPYVDTWEEAKKLQSEKAKAVESLLANQPQPTGNTLKAETTKKEVDVPILVSEVEIPKLTTVKVDLKGLTLDELKNVAKQLRQKAINARDAEKQGKSVIGGSQSVENDYQAVKKYISELDKQSQKEGDVPIPVSEVEIEKQDVLNPDRYVDDYLNMDFNEEKNAIPDIQKEINKIQSLVYPLTVYRAINTKIDRTERGFDGGHWSTDKVVAESFGDKLEERVINSASEIDLEQTIRSRVMNPAEKEIYIPKKEVDIKNQLSDFGVQEKDVDATHNLLSQVFNTLKKAGLTAAKNLGEWVGIGKGVEQKGSLFQPTIYGNTGLVKSPSFDSKSADKAIKSGRVKTVSPKESLEGLTFAVTRPDDLFVGDIHHNGEKVGSFDGGVFYPLNGGEKGKMWASVSSGSASGFSNQANRSLLKNNGVELPNGFAGETLTYKKGDGQNEWVAINKSGKEFSFKLPENPKPKSTIVNCFSPFWI